jgi:hemerythrin-like metal-binding protein
MEIHHYPQRSQHIEEHERFSQRVVEIQKEFQRGKTNLSLEVMQFLKNWLTEHILKTDAAYGTFAKGLPHS